MEVTDLLNLDSAEQIVCLFDGDGVACPLSFNKLRESQLYSPARFSTPNQNRAPIPSSIQLHYGFISTSFDATYFLGCVHNGDIMIYNHSTEKAIRIARPPLAGVEDEAQATGCGFFSCFRPHALASIAARFACLTQDNKHLAIITHNNQIWLFANAFENDGEDVSKWIFVDSVQDFTRCELVFCRDKLFGYTLCGYIANDTHCTLFKALFNSLSSKATDKRHLSVKRPQSITTSSVVLQKVPMYICISSGAEIFLVFNDNTMSTHAIPKTFDGIDDGKFYSSAVVTKPMNTKHMPKNSLMAGCSIIYCTESGDVIIRDWFLNLIKMKIGMNVASFQRTLNPFSFLALHNPTEGLLTNSVSVQALTIADQGFQTLLQNYISDKSLPIPDRMRCALRLAVLCEEGALVSQEVLNQFLVLMSRIPKISGKIIQEVTEIDRYDHMRYFTTLFNPEIPSKTPRKVKKPLITIPLSDDAAAPTAMWPTKPANAAALPLESSKDIDDALDLISSVLQRLGLDVDHSISLPFPWGNWTADIVVAPHLEEQLWAMKDETFTDEETLRHLLTWVFSRLFVCWSLQTFSSSEQRLLVRKKMYPMSNEQEFRFVRILFFINVRDRIATIMRQSPVNSSALAITYAMLTHYYDLVNWTSLMHKIMALLSGCDSVQTVQSVLSVLREDELMGKLRVQFRQLSALVADQSDWVPSKSSRLVFNSNLIGVVDRKLPTYDAAKKDSLLEAVQQQRAFQKLVERMTTIKDEKQQKFRKSLSLRKVPRIKRKPKKEGEIKNIDTVEEVIVNSDISNVTIEEEEHKSEPVKEPEHKKVLVKELVEEHMKEPVDDKSESEEDESESEEDEKDVVEVKEPFKRSPKKNRPRLFHLPPIQDARIVGSKPKIDPVVPEKPKNIEEVVTQTDPIPETPMPHNNMTLHGTDTDQTPLEQLVFAITEAVKRNLPTPKKQKVENAPVTVAPITVEPIPKDKYVFLKANSLDKAFPSQKKTKKASSVKMFRIPSENRKKSKKTVRFLHYDPIQRQFASETFVKLPKSKRNAVENRSRSSSHTSVSSFVSNAPPSSAASTHAFSESSVSRPPSSEPTRQVIEPLPQVQEKPRTVTAPKTGRTLRNAPQTATINLDMPTLMSTTGDVVSTRTDKVLFPPKRSNITTVTETINLDLVTTATQAGISHQTQDYLNRPIKGTPIVIESPVRLNPPPRPIEPISSVAEEETSKRSERKQYRPKQRLKSLSLDIAAASHTTDEHMSSILSSINDSSLLSVSEIPPRDINVIYSHAGALPQSPISSPPLPEHRHSPKTQIETQSPKREEESGPVDDYDLLYHELNSATSLKDVLKVMDGMRALDPYEGYQKSPALQEHVTKYVDELEQSLRGLEDGTSEVTDSLSIMNSFIDDTLRKCDLSVAVPLDRIPGSDAELAQLLDMNLANVDLTDVYALM
ncbi:hypothetical protein PCE1_003298 [Barthelona sp. PCE]